MTRITKSTMCHLLYCLNWHIKESRTSARDSTLTEHERESLSARIKALKQLKGKTLVKLVLDGYAEIHGTQVDIWVKPPVRFYSIRLNREFSFHFPMKEFAVLIDEQEEIRSIKAKSKTEAGDT